MVTLVMAKKGFGKTKRLIELVNQAVETEHGIVVCIEKGTKLTLDINHKARLIDTTTYKIGDYNTFYGFVCGVIASNYDVTSVFIDSILKIAGEDLNELANFLEKIETIAKDSNVKFYINATYDPTEAPEKIKRFIA